MIVLKDEMSVKAFTPSYKTLVAGKLVSKYLLPSARLTRVLQKQI